MRTVHKPPALCCRQHQWKAAVGGGTKRTFRGLDIAWQRRITVLTHQLRVDFDPAGRCGKAHNRGIPLRERVFLVTERLREAETFRMPSESFDARAERSDLIIPAGLNVAAEELFRQAQPDGELRGDFVVRLAFAELRQDPGTELECLDGFLRDLESDFKRIAFPRHACRQDDVRILGCRIHEHIDVDVEFERPQSRAIARRVALRDDEIRAEAQADQRSHLIRLAGENGAAEVSRSNPASAWRTER